MNFSKYHEFWLAAQHDSHHTSMAAGWQGIAYCVGYTSSNQCA